MAAWRTSRPSKPTVDAAAGRLRAPRCRVRPALTEARLQHALRQLLAGRTSFVVAHRLSTIRHADLVLVLDQGRLIERGTHEELLTRRGHYAGLYRQFVQVDDGA